MFEKSGEHELATWSTEVSGETSNRPLIVVSGLPASGKTTLAVWLAREFRLPLFDKDDILEALFETAGAVDSVQRNQLSRMSDDVLVRLASASQGAVLVSHWRHEGSPARSGTPAGFLRTLSKNLVEVHCVCSPEVAEQRFKARQRHPAHRDADRAPTLAAQFQGLANMGPLGVGRTVRLRTDQPYDTDRLVEDVRTYLA